MNMVRGTPCIKYDGTRDRSGYGILPKAVDGSRLAHRAALTQKLGRRLEGQALHHCDNPPCVNPDHLYEGSPQDNADDRVARGLARGGRYNQTHCKWGHEFTPENTRWSNGHRSCRTCYNQRLRERRAANRKAVAA